MSEISWWFNGWEPIARTLSVGTLGYLALVTLLRVSKKRSLSQLTAFDFVVAIAIGSAFGRVLTAQAVALSEALAAFTLLVALQYAISSLQERSPKLGRLISASPSLLFYQGQFVEAAMHKERVTEEDIHCAVRCSGVGAMALVGAVVLETNGQISVIPKEKAGSLMLTDKTDRTG